MVTLSLYRNSSHSFDLKIAIFGNFLKQNVAKNGQNMTQVPIEGQSN